MRTNWIEMVCVYCHTRFAVVLRDRGTNEPLPCPSRDCYGVLARGQQAGMNAPVPKNLVLVA